MFVYTAKMNRKKLLVSAMIAVGALAVILILFIFRSTGAAETLSQSAVVKTNEQRIDYLCSLGWQVEQDPIDEQTVVIPSEISGVYRDYNDLQLKQGFDLSDYGGVEATRYSYSVLNYPGETDGIVADIIVYRGRIIAGDIQSTALDGFMHTLDYPK